MKFAGWKQLRIMNAFAMLVWTLLGLFHIDHFFKVEPQPFWSGLE